MSGSKKGRRVSSGRLTFVTPLAGPVYTHTPVVVAAARDEEWTVGDARSIPCGAGPVSVPGRGRVGGGRSPSGGGPRGQGTCGFVLPGRGQRHPGTGSAAGRDPESKERTSYPRRI